MKEKSISAVEVEKARADEMVRFLSSSEVAELMGCDVRTVREIMRRKDFPAVKIGKAYKVTQLALAEWASVRRD